MHTKKAKYGEWASPITTELITGQMIGLNGACLFDGAIYWTEGRPSEGGRSVVVRRDASGREIDLVPAGMNARTRVHEYGGKAALISSRGLFFSNFKDQALYRTALDGSGQAAPVADADGVRYADAVLDEKRNRLICVREDHRSGGEAVNTLAAIGLTGGVDHTGGTVLAGGNDFYASPRLSPDGERLAWLTWKHPNMPWDGCELWVAGFDAAGAVTGARRVAGSATDSIFQPEWGPDGALYFVAEPGGWWNLYRWRADAPDAIESLHPMQAEFGEPQWQFGQSTYAFVTPTTILCTYSQAGFGYLATLDTQSLAFHTLETPYAVFSGLQADRAHGRAVFVVGSTAALSAIVQYDHATGGFEVIKRAGAIHIDPGYLSLPQAIEFNTAHGKTAHGFFYPPTNKDYEAPADERPPLLVKSHGGPTGATDPGLDLRIQYWTSRGIAVLDVNYGGSTGYGKEYRQRLNGTWGITDVDDCTNGALHLAEQGLVDRKRLMITGGSAGGFTTLCALTFRDVFSAGASYYGVSDAEALAKDTHKFESRYLDSMIGPYPAKREVYIERSPVHFTDRISAPLILLQGLEDAVVPPDQSERMYQAVKAKGIPTAYIAFEGEQHGFRQAKNIKRALEAEFYFYGRVFGYKPADRIDPFAIDNLPGEPAAA